MRHENLLFVSLTAALLLMAIGWWSLGCGKDTECDCSASHPCPDDDEADDDAGDDDDGSPQTPTPDDRPPVSLAAKIDYSNKWSIWELSEPKNYPLAAPYLGEQFIFDGDDVPLVTETNLDEHSMVLNVYIDEEWKKISFNDYDCEHANDFCFDNDGNLTLLSTADSGSFYISQFDDHYQSRTVRSACGHVSGGFSRMAYLADDSPFIIYGGGGLYSCVYYPWADNWFIQPLVPYFIPSGWSDPEIVQDTNGYVAIFYQAQDLITDDYYWAAMRKRLGVWQHDRFGELDGNRFDNYYLHNVGRRADGRVYFIVEARMDEEPFDYLKANRIQVYESGPQPWQPWKLVIETDHYQYWQKGSKPINYYFALAPDGTLGAFVWHYLETPFEPNGFDLFGVYSEYRNGLWTSELVDFPRYPGKYQQDRLIFEYDSQGRPGVAVHLRDGSIYFLWRNLD